jgi:hypothetical protein
MRHDEDSNCHRTENRETEMKITTIGLDLAKTVFHVVGQGLPAAANDPWVWSHRGRGVCRDRTACLTLVRSHGGIALRFACPFSISRPFPSQFYFGSSVRSQPPFVHGFPCPDDASRIARRRHTAFPYVDPLLPGLQDFILHAVTKAEAVIRDPGRAYKSTRSMPPEPARFTNQRCQPGRSSRLASSTTM